jgi:phosphatidylserine/phosphatidylglycerophosphate/cardiolipin synthase-like enzyme
VTRIFSVLAFTIYALASPAWAEPPAVEMHWSPAEALDDVDAELIGQAGLSVDVAAYILTDGKVERALLDASRRGVAVRIVLDPREKNSLDRLGELAASVRYSHDSAPFHLKSYAVDGVVLRTGSANFTKSGETAQQNDLVILRDPQFAARFEARFERMWDSASGGDAAGEATPLFPALDRLAKQFGIE